MNQRLHLAHSRARRNESVKVTGVWLRRIGDDAQVLVEVDGHWRLICEELLDGNFSHIVEPSGIMNSPIDLEAG